MTRKIINLALSYAPDGIAKPLKFINDIENLRRYGYTKQDFYRVGQANWH